MAFERVTADPARMAGAPTIRGTRVTVAAILGQLAAGRTHDEILDDFPSIEREDILAVLAFAAATVVGERPFAVA